VVFALDQIVKWAMMGPLDLPRVEQITLLPIFFTWAENYGVSLGLLTAGSDLERWLLVGMTGAIALGVAIWIFMEKRVGEIRRWASCWAARWAISLIGCPRALWWIMPICTLGPIAPSTSSTLPMLPSPSAY
jgi:hypothetical protein